MKKVLLLLLIFCIKIIVISTNSAGNTLRFVNHAQSKLNLTKDADLILVIGNTGCGKSTLVHYVAADYSRIFAERPKIRGQPLVVRDELDPVKEQQTSSSQSRTLIPEMITDEEKHIWVDSPGFGDTRNATVEIATTFLIKKVIESAANLKLVLVVNYNSVIISGSRDDFDNLLERTTQLIPNVTHFANSVTLVVSKVPPMTEYGEELLDNDLRNLTVEFMDGHRAYLLQKGSSESKIELMNALSEKSADGDYHKITAFWRPNKIGAFNTIPRMIDGRESIRKSTIGISSYQKVQMTDFGFPLTADALIEVGKIITHTDNETLNILIFIKDQLVTEIQKQIDFTGSFEHKVKLIDLGQSVAQPKHQNKRITPTQLTEYYEAFVSKFNLTMIAMPSFNRIKVNLSNRKVFVSLVEDQNDYQSESKIYFDLANEIINLFSEYEQKIQNKIKDITWQMIKSIKSSIPRVEVQTIKELQRKLESTLDIQSKFELFARGRNGSWANGNATTATEWASQIRDIIEEYNLTTVDTTELSRIEREETYVELLKPICKIEKHFDLIIIPTLATKYPAQMYDWYAFLTSTFDTLIDFKVQSSVKSFMTKGGFTTIVANSAKYSPTEAQMKEFEMMTDAILKPPDYNCNDDVLNITGNIMRSSDIRTDRCPLSDKVKKINVFVVHTFYVDGDLNLGALNEVELHILTNTFDVRRKSVFNLNGKNGESQETPTTKGTAGKNGNPGQSSGNFFGWANKVINGDSLTVMLNGGNGANGQDGTGSDNVEVKFNEIEDECEVHEFRKDCTTVLTCAMCLMRKYRDGVDWKYDSWWGGYETAKECNYRTFTRTELHPKNCCGKTGEGGVGGIGGNAGYYTFLLRGSTSTNLPIPIRKNGANGVAGQNGKPCTSKGLKLRICQLPDDLRSNAAKIIALSIIYLKFTPDGIIDSYKCPYSPARDENATKKPNPLKKLNVAPIIFDYKNFLFENISDAVFLQTIQQTQQTLEFSPDMNSINVFTSFAMEANALERQFYKSTDENRLLPFHENLLRRIEEYTMQSNEILSAKDKQILALIYSVIYSKTTEIRSSHSSDMIIDIEEFFKLTVKNIGELKQIGEVKVIDEQRENYNNEIAAKRQEAIDFINNDIEPEMQKMFTKLDDEMDKTIEEVKSMQSGVEEEILKKKEDYKTMRRNVQIRKVTRVFKIVGGLASLIPKAGPIISATIDTAAEFVENDLKDPSKRGKFNVPMGIKNIRQQADQDKNERIEAIESIFEGLKKKSGIDAEFDKKITYLTAKIDTVKRDKSSDGSIEVAEHSINFVKGYLSTIEKHGPEDMKDMKKALKKASDGLTVAISSISQFKKIQGDEDSLSEFAKAINDDTDTLKSLLLFEKQIYADLMPTINSLHIHFSDVSGSLNEKSLVALDVMHWKVGNTMRIVQKKLRDAFSGFTTENEISNCLVFINEAMGMLIKIFDRIQTYEDHTKFANYLTNIQNADFEKQFIRDAQLRISISEMQYNLHANLIFGQQYRAVNAFKQAIFPFAADYLDLFQLPESLAINNTNAVISFATQQVELLSQRIKKFNDTVINKNDQSIRIAHFTRDPGSSGPFYVWKNGEVRDKIEQLFAGKKIYLLADIANSFGRNAVKFKIIDLVFRSENKMLNNELKAILKYFSASLLHMGESNYRCNDNVYTMDTRPLNITYSYSKKGEQNFAYRKLKNGPPMLSPYTLWTLQLLQGDYKKLEPFVDLVDIELHGFGQYTDGGASVCNTDLAKYYALKKY